MAKPDPPTPSPAATLPILSPLAPVALQIAPKVYRPFYPLVARAEADGSGLTIDGWLFCTPDDASLPGRWLRNSSIPQLPDRRTPWVWVELRSEGDAIGQWKDQNTLLDVEIAVVDPIHQTAARPLHSTYGSALGGGARG